MSNTRSMARNENHDALSKRRCETSENDGPTPWSDLTHDVLLLVMMQLSGVVEFVSFSGVCKSWRSLALSNRNKFMVSRPRMSIFISAEYGKKDYYCYLEEFGGRRLKTIIPHSAGMTCIGFTCGYLVLFTSKNHIFFLVNPITRHELYFPNLPASLENDYPRRTRAILVYSPSISGLVFVVLCPSTMTIWFSVAGTRVWNHVTPNFLFSGLHFFKGKIYTLVSGCRLCKLSFDPEPKLTLLESKNSLTFFYYMDLVSLGENLCVVGLDSRYPSKFVVQELDFAEMRWMSSEKRIGEYGLFVGDVRYGNPVKLESESWADPRSQYERYASFNDTTDKSRKGSLLL